MQNNLDDGSSPSTSVASSTDGNSVINEQMSRRTKHIKPSPLQVLDSSLEPNRNVSAKMIPEAYGATVDEKHTNYVLMYDMLTGIRTSVSRCQAKPSRPLTSRDFKAVQKLSFSLTGSDQTPSSRYDFKFKDYAPWVFRFLRESLSVDTGDYLIALTGTYVLSELYSPGKSGSLFYYSQDYKYIIKTIKEPEYTQLRRILPFYYEHIQKNSSSLLVRFFGLHRLKLPNKRRFYFIVMQNIIPAKIDISETYDIKGATADRLVPDDAAQTDGRTQILKDLNWIARKRKLTFGPQKATLLVSQLHEDCKLLSKLKIMDYSILIGIHEIGDEEKVSFWPDSVYCKLKWACREKSMFLKESGGIRSSTEENLDARELYFMGIIDILTPYSTFKKIEHIFKAIRYSGHEISTVNPSQYANRLLSFVKSKLLRDSTTVDYTARPLPAIPEVTVTDDDSDVINVTLGG